MTDDKKDLTGIIQHSKEMQEAGKAPPLPEGAIMEEVPIEEINDFESLEDYAAANPASVTSTPSEETDESSPSQESPPAEIGQFDFPVTDSDSSSSPPSEFETSPSQEAFPQSDLNEASIGLPSEFENSILPPSSSDLGEDIGDLDGPPPLSSSPLASLPIPASSAPPVEKSPNSTMENVKKYSDAVTTSKTPVQAAFPFSLLIHGRLLPEEKERLLDLISRENMGIREIDLEPQFTSGRILLPRLSEFAGIMIIQALRGTRAQIKLGPSDTIFSTPDTRTDSEETLSSVEDHSTSYSSEITHPAENLPITSENQVPGISELTLIDMVTASASLRSNVVEAERSTEYQEIIEALQREIKYKAYRKGAAAVINFKIQQTTVSSPTHYKILAMGTAVRERRSREAAGNTTTTPSLPAGVPSASSLLPDSQPPPNPQAIAPNDNLPRSLSASVPLEDPSKEIEIALDPPDLTSILTDPSKEG
jgi:uncharacterized protein YbjQ (UPF0145 family)